MYLLVNIADLDAMGKMPMLGSPLNLMIREELGDRLLSGSLRHKSQLDDVYCVIECADDTRPQAIIDALNVIANRKIRRKVRTMIRERLPSSLIASKDFMA